MVRRRSTVRFCQGARWRRSSVGESARLIIERSTVRICPSLRTPDPCRRPVKGPLRRIPMRPPTGGREKRERGRHGVRQASAGHPGVPGVQAPELHHHQVQGEQPRADRAQEVLPLVPVPRGPQGDPLTADPACGTSGRRW